MTKFKKKDYIPAYIRLKNELKTEIETRKLKSGERLGSHKELSERFGVSRVTVRQALKELEREGYLNMVPKIGTFVAKRENDIENKGLITLLIPTIQSPFFAEIAQEIENILLKENYHMILCSTEDKGYDFIVALKDKVDGFIIAPRSSSEDKHPYRELQKSNIPFVFFDKAVQGIQSDYVLVNNYLGACLAVNHLIEQGHRKIACIADFSMDENVSERVRGYQETLNEHNLTECIIYTDEPASRSQGYKTAQKFFQLKDKFTAIFATHDILCLGIIEAVREKGLTIPDDVALVGFDDLSIDELLQIPLTTIAHPKSMMAKNVTTLLLNRINGKAKSEIHQILLEPKLVVRLSSINKKNKYLHSSLSNFPGTFIESFGD